MFAVVVRESGDAAQIDASGSLVREGVAPSVRKVPGFVSALWMTNRSGATLNVLVFESEQSARAAMEGARGAPRPPFMHVEAVDLYSVLAST